MYKLVLHTGQPGACKGDKALPCETDEKINILLGPKSVNVLKLCWFFITVLYLAKMNESVNFIHQMDNKINDTDMQNHQMQRWDNDFTKKRFDRPRFGRQPSSLGCWQDSSSSRC